MNMQHVKQLMDLVSWIKENAGLTANLDLNIWSHKTSDNQTTEYRLWIEDTFNQSSKDSAMLIALIPYVKNLCTKNRILENNNQLKELAA